MFQQTLWVAERSLRIRTDRAEVRDYLSAACARLAIDGPAAEAPCDEATILWEHQRPTVTCNGKRLTAQRASEDPVEAAVRAVAALLSDVFRRLSRHRALYAAGVSSSDATFALVGPSGIGKTTLAVELVRRGWRTFGDEFVLLERGTFTMHPFELAFMLREPALGLCEDWSLSRHDRIATRIGGKQAWHGFDVVDLFGASAVAAPQRLTHLIFLERASEVRRGVEPLRAAGAAFELLPNLFIERPELQEIWEVLDRLASVACYRLFFEDYRAAADALQRLAGESPCTSTPAI